MPARDKKGIFEAFLRGEPGALKDVESWANRGINHVARNSRAFSFEDREDLRMETIRRLFDQRKQSRSRAIKDPEAWVFMVAENLARDWLRGSSRRPKTAPEINVEMCGQSESQNRKAEVAALASVERALLPSLEYIDLAFRWRRAYRSNAARMSRTIQPLLDAKDVLRRAAAAFEPMFQAQIPEADQERLIGPLVAELVTTRQRLDEEIRLKVYAPGGADGPDHPLDFNQFLPDVLWLRLRPATLIYRVWSKIIKKSGPGGYTDNKRMEYAYQLLRDRFAGTDKEYLFEGDFDPKALRVEAHKRSKMKAFYDRLATWISQKAVVDRRTLEEELAYEDRHIPDYELKVLRAAAGRDSGGRRGK